MKRLYLLLIPLLLVLALMACESSGNNNGGTNVESNDSQSAASGIDSTEESSLPDLSGLNEKSFDIPVTLDGAEALANAGLKADPRTISVTVKASDDILEALTASDITAKVDVSGISDVGNVELDIAYSAPESVYIVDSQTYITIKI